MTGGSLPAMTWQRLMEYAHQNIDLKPIPGIDNPFVDAEIAAKAKASRREGRRRTAAPGEPADERPPMLSAATTRLLKGMAETFRTAPPMPPASGRPETLSAL